MRSSLTPTASQTQRLNSIFESMRGTPLKLPLNGPRRYRLRDAYDDRVWRSPVAVWAREIIGWSLSAGFLGLLANHSMVFAASVATCLLALVTLVIGSLSSNYRRAQTVRDGEYAEGMITAHRRLTFAHEFLRRDKERTFKLTYRFLLSNGDAYETDIWVCGCAKEYFPIGMNTPIVYRAGHIDSALPLRLAVMYAPHR